MASRSCLVVNDSLMNRQLAAYALGRVDDLQITEAEDEVDMLRKLESTSFDIVVLDTRMQNKSGMMVLENLKCSAKHRNLPVVMMGPDNESLRSRAEQLGVLKYFPY